MPISPSVTGRKRGRSPVARRSRTPPPAGVTEPGPSANVPATGERPSRTTRKQHSQPQSSPRDTGAGCPVNVAAAGQRSPSTRCEVQSQRILTPGDTRRTQAATKQRHSHDRSYREQPQQRSVNSVDIEEHDQTQQMRRVIRELQTLIAIYDSYSSSSVGTGDYDPRVRQVRQRVLVRLEVLNELEREVVHLNRLIWNSPQLPSVVRPRRSYNTDIMEILHTVHDLEQRYETFKRMLRSLQLSESGGQHRTDARREKIRQLKLVLQDVGVELAEQDRRRDREAMKAREQELTSSSTPTVGSRAESHLPEIRRPRPVHLVKPL